MPKLKQQYTKRLRARIWSSFNNLKNQSSLYKNRKILNKYSNANSHTHDGNLLTTQDQKFMICKFSSNFIAKHSSKSSCHHTKNLKVKKSHGYKTMHKDIAKTQYSSESTASVKKANFSLAGQQKKRSRQISRRKDDPESGPKTKPTGSQLMSYTNKSKRLATSTESSSKVNLNTKKRSSNSTSWNFIKYTDTNSVYHGDRKMSKYVPAKNPSKGSKNRTEEYGHGRRVNTSTSHISNSHFMNSTKSKGKKKKKASHMKSHSNIPVYYEGNISTKGSGKKQYSGSKSKKKKTWRHTHHQSQSNGSISLGTKSNMVLVDNNIAIKDIMGIQNFSPSGNTHIVIPSTNVISMNEMVKGGLKDKASHGHTRTLSDHYSYNFQNNNHIYTSGPSTLDNRMTHMKGKSKDKKSLMTYDIRKKFISPKHKPRYSISVVKTL